MLHNQRAIRVATHLTTGRMILFLPPVRLFQRTLTIERLS